jgi:hypothetical protein
MQRSEPLAVVHPAFFAGSEGTRHPTPNARAMSEQKKQTRRPAARKRKAKTIKWWMRQHLIVPSNKIFTTSNVIAKNWKLNGYTVRSVRVTVE